MHSSGIAWGFRPPFVGDAASQGSEAQEGIWLRDFKPKAGSGWVDYEAQEGRSGEEDHTAEGSDSEEECTDEEEEEEEDSADEKAVRAIQSVFSALEVEGEDSDGDRSEVLVEAEDEYDEEDDSE